MDDRTKELIDRTTRTIERIDRRRLLRALKREAPPMSERAKRWLARSRVAPLPVWVKRPS